MKTIEEARKRWSTLFRNNDQPSDLKTSLKEQGGTLCSDGLRSVYWKAFLLFNDIDRTQWPRKVSESRSTYSALRSHFLKHIEYPDDLQSTIDPLADDEESPWQTLRCDEKLRAEISQDVDRCLQENFFFREPATKSKMVDILFIYCKLNPDLGYRQGMHELLAPILWVVDRDAVDAKSEVGSSGTGDDLLSQILDVSYIEHDAFVLFCPVMQTARLYYEHQAQPSAAGQVDTIPIVNRCQHIHNDLLRAADPELGERMQTLEILPQIFLTRWMRLLFGREFPFEDTLLIWDLLFANGLDPDLVDLVCIAMLLRIRWQLLNADHSSALTMLLRYPSPRPHSPQTFVYDALSLQQSLTFETGRFIIAKYSGNAPSLSKRPSQASMETTTDKVHSRRDFKDSSEGNPSGRSLASSGPRSLETLLQDVSEGIQRRTETWGVAKAVRGAVTDARRNMHTMQWEARPRATRSEDITTFTPKEVHWAQESNATDLKTRVELLEERNKVLAKMLGQAFDDLRSHMAKVEVDADPASGIIQALTKVESVQICLENSSIPLESTDMYFSGSDDAGHKLGPKEVGEEKAGDDSSTEKTRVPPKSPIPPEGEKAKSRITSSSNRDTPISLPSRPTARPSLAESEFSWMLGGDRHLSSFASPASLPPEQTRQLDGKAKPGTLFSNGDEGERRGSAESDVAMNSLRGHKTGSRF